MNSILNYQIKRVLGEGGMGKVYLAVHNKIDRKVAIKELHPHLSKDKGLRERFKNEAALMANLSHPNIVTLHDYIETPTSVYLIMEYVEGIPLDDYIEKVSGPIPEKKAIEMFVKILDAFDYAHQSGIIHRDIKPSNIMVTKDGDIKILDFGIAKMLNSPENQLTRTGMKIGTIFYMSPEQIRALDIDTRSDIYSLGVTLFEMLTSRNPYNKDLSEYDISHKVVNEPLPKAKTFYPNISEHIQEVIDKATAKNPANRFQNVMEFKEALLHQKTTQDIPKYKGTTIEWVIQSRNEPETKNKEDETYLALKNSKKEKEIEVFVFENAYGKITNRKVIYLKGKDLFESGKKEELLLRKIISTELKTHREILSGIIFLSLALVLCIFLFNIFTLSISIVLILFSFLCFFRFPTVVIHKSDMKKINMRGWPWHIRKASEFVWHLKDELLRMGKLR